MITVAYCGDGGAGVTSNDPCCQIFLGMPGSTGNGATTSTKGSGSNGGTGATTTMATTESGNGGISVAVNGGTTVGINNNGTVSGIVGGSTPSSPADGLTATTIAIAVGFTGGLFIIAGLYFFIAYRKKRVRTPQNRQSESQKQQQPHRSPINIFQDQPTNIQGQSYFAGAIRDPGTSTSQEQILPSASPIPIDTVGNNVNSKNRASNSEYDEEFNYGPTNGSIARSSRFSFLRDETLARPTRTPAQQQQDYRISVNEVNRNGNFVSGPSNYTVDNTKDNQYSVYSEVQTDGGRANDGYNTMDSAASEAFNAETSQYSSYVSEYSDYQASEYRPVSYSLANSVAKNQGGRGGGGGTDDGYQDLLRNNNNQLSYTETDDRGMFKVKVLFPYEKDMDDELSLKPGEIGKSFYFYFFS
ncbi:UNVERIFIED_CONTAM: hypothetical protein HDU68_005947 [Siphonaria sp. JEL0065]|nr:hypothetical protein HDU68_005947 [Siphonaria sp. JEL0065]